MPRWARFLACTVTGGALALGGVLLAAYLTEPAPHFWSGFVAFAATRAFRGLVLLFGVIAAVVVLVTRALVNLCGLPEAVAGFLAGSALALCYTAALTASHLQVWGGWVGVSARLWPGAAWFGLPFALAGALVGWLWERLD